MSIVCADFCFIYGEHYIAKVTTFDQPTDAVGLNQVPKQGLNVPFRDGLLKHVAQDVFKLAKVRAALQSDFSSRTSE